MSLFKSPKNLLPSPHRRLLWLRPKSQPWPTFLPPQMNQLLPHLRPKAKSLPHQALELSPNQLARDRVIIPLVPAKEWRDLEFHGPAIILLLPARAWPVRVLRAETVQVLVQEPAPALQGEARAVAHAPRSNNVQAAPAVGAREAPVVPVVLLAPVVADQEAAADLVVVAAVAPVAEPLEPLAGVARRASLASPSGQSARNLR